MACVTNACNFCSNGDGSGSSVATVESISWPQITPILMNAERVLLEKYKIDSKGVVTKDERDWVLSTIQWAFKPLNKTSATFEIQAIASETKAADATQGTAPGTGTGATGDPADTTPTDVDKEVFDFLSDVFKLYYDSKTDTIFGEVETIEAGLTVTYRYTFHFYGKQKVEYSDLMVFKGTDDKAHSSLLNNGCSGSDIINRVIAL